MVTEKNVKIVTIEQSELQYEKSKDFGGFTANVVYIATGDEDTTLTKAQNLFLLSKRKPFIESVNFAPTIEAAQKDNEISDKLETRTEKIDFLRKTLVGMEIRANAYKFPLIELLSGTEFAGVSILKNAKGGEFAAETYIDVFGVHSKDEIFTALKNRVLSRLESGKYEVPNKESESK